MPISGKDLIKWTLLAVPVLLLTAVAAAADKSMSERSLAADTIIKEIFQAGTGLPVGKIQGVRGDTFIFHRDLSTGYRARTGLPLYQGDIVRTRNNARIFFRLVDGTTIALAPGTMITILQANLNSARKTSESFLALKQGAARFKVNPMAGLETSGIKVETEIAFIQARAADFIVKTDPASTEIVTMENSRLEMTNLVDPEEMHFLSDYQRAVVRPDSAFPLIEDVTREDIAPLLSLFRFVPDNTYFTFSAPGDRSQDSNRELPEDQEIIEEVPIE